jgi:hypothetical protein
LGLEVLLELLHEECAAADVWAENHRLHGRDAGYLKALWRAAWDLGNGENMIQPGGR